MTDQNKKLKALDKKKILDKVKIEELWTPLVKTWFSEGKDESNISVLKVKPTTAYCWDTDGNRMINYLKMVASIATATNLVIGKKELLQFKILIS